ncbi:MAG TPA: hypothetical protein VGN12_06200 [Pirellulales bacterium]
MDERKSLKQRLWEDVKTMAALFAYLAVFLGAFTTYKRLLLAEYGVPFFEYGCALVEALLLSKVIVLGRALRVGERFTRSPLAMPALYKTFCFCLLVLAMTIGEHFVVGWWHGESRSALVASLAKEGVWEIPARVLTWFIAFVPLFAFFEVDRVLGEGTLVKLFFAGNRERTAPEPVIPMRAAQKQKVIPTARVKNSA